jgi:hypothetical protein
LIKDVVTKFRSEQTLIGEEWKGLLACSLGINQQLNLGSTNIGPIKEEGGFMQASDGSDRGSARFGMSHYFADWIWIAFPFQICPE